MSELKAEVTGTVWKILCSPGQTVKQGDTIMITESMKMEIPVEAVSDGVLEMLHVQEGDSVREGDTVATLA